jgi:hypothetical protein
MPELSDYLSCAETAKVLGVTPLTLGRWRTKRQGPPVTKLGGRFLYKKSSLTAWLTAQEQVAS